MKKIAIIGSGQIGSRHLQGLAKIKEELEITVIDPSVRSLELARDRYLQVEESDTKSKVNYSQSIPPFKELDLAIIATSSDIRKKVINELLELSSPNYVLIEKVAFQNLQDFKEIIHTFRDRGIKSWVNCPNRSFKSYKGLKQDLNNERPLEMHVRGGNWGLASNAIHYIDLFSFLIESTNLKVSESSINNKIYPSKRKGFVELGGSFTINSSDNDLLIIEDQKSTDEPVSVTFSTPHQKIVINELLQESLSLSKKSSLKEYRSSFELTNQSTLTTDIVFKILSRESCDLIDLENSYRLHEIIIPFFLKEMNKISSTSIKDCPIT